MLNAKFTYKKSWIWCSKSNYFACRKVFKERSQTAPPTWTARTGGLINLLSQHLQIILEHSQPQTFQKPALSVFLKCHTLNILHNALHRHHPALTRYSKKR